jgi:3-oxoacyl-[acyl-carrier protein] reductase
MPGLAIVTGAGRGIGKAIALALADAGHPLVICARSEPELEATAEAVRERGGHATVVPADVSSEEDLKRLVAVGREHGQPIEVLVNNAGVSPKPREGRRTPLTEMTTHEWNEVMAINLTSAFVLTRDVGALMCRAKRGSIINISSIAVRMGAPTAGAHYVASKAGMVGLTKATAREFAPFGVRANSIAPGRITTALTEISNRSLEPGWIDRHIPLAREGDPREIADAVVFLASDKSSYITGCTIDVTGGWTMT